MVHPDGDHGGVRGRAIGQQFGARVPHDLHADRRVGVLELPGEHHVRHGGQQHAGHAVAAHEGQRGLHPQEVPAQRQVVPQLGTPGHQEQECRAEGRVGFDRTAACCEAHGGLAQHLGQPVQKDPRVQLAVAGGVRAAVQRDEVVGVRGHGTGHAQGHAHGGHLTHQLGQVRVA